jgi:hypothetical protein
VEAHRADEVEDHPDCGGHPDGRDEHPGQCPIAPAISMAASGGNQSSGTPMPVSGVRAG